VATTRVPAVTGTGAPLDGILVADFTRILAGPYATMLLADLGADVIKVEGPPSGDDTRSWTPPERDGAATYYLAINRGKRSIQLDLGDAHDAGLARQLARRADVFVENFKPGGLVRFRLDYESVRAENPSVVYASISGFGDGAGAHLPAYDLVVQALSGLMSLTGAADGPAYRAGVSVIDLFAGHHAVIGILAALRHREATGEGQRVETSLLHASLALQSGSIVDYPGKPVFARENPTYRLYEAGDGEWFFLACGNQSFWGKLTKALGLEHLRDDPRFAGWLLRLEHSSELLPILIETFRSKPCAEWMEVLGAHDIPAGRVQPLAEFVNDPAVRHHDMIHEYEAHPDVGRLTLMGQPIKLAPAATRDPGPPPALDQHTDEVLRELGYDAAAIADLRARRVIGATPGAGRAPRAKPG